MPNAEIAHIAWSEAPTPVPAHYNLPSVATVRHWRYLRSIGVVDPGHPAHRTRAAEIGQDAIQTRATTDLVDQLRKTADQIVSGNPRRGIPPGPGLVGLAAPQLGCSRRVALVDISHKTEPDSDSNHVSRDAGELTVMINPVWTPAPDSPELAIGHMCYSLMGAGAYYDAPTHGVVEWYDLKGNRREQELHKYGGIVVGHEIDHFDTTFFTDRAQAQGRPVLAVSAEEQKAFFAAGEAGAEAAGLSVYSDRQLHDYTTGVYRPEHLLIPGDHGYSAYGRAA